MSFITYSFVGLYAVLTGVAGITQWKENGFQVRTFLFIIISICMLGVLWISDKMILIGILILVFIVLHILAVLEGWITNGKVRFSHHLLRFVFHIVLVLLVYQFIV
jgi:hypothetical protein